MLFLLLACSSPTATITTGSVDDLPRLNGIDAYVTGKLQRAVDRCYAEALAGDGGLGGTVTVTVMGSHGILKVASEDEGALARCVKTPLEDSRTQRQLGEGDNTAGTAFTVVFAP